MPLFFDQTGGANEAARQAWWWSANPGQGAPAPPAPPDVPADGLYVEGGPNGPAASAAVLFQLQDGETPQQLTLHLVPLAQGVQSQAPPPPAGVPAPPPAPADPTSSLPPPALQACLIPAGTFTAEQGGPMADAPTADCAKPLAATVDATAGTAKFDLSSLTATGTTVAIAILPVGPTDRAGFAHPGGDALTVLAGSSTAASTDSSTATSSDSSAVTSSDSATSSAPTATGDLSSSGSLGYVPGQASTGAPSVAAPAPSTAPAAAPAPAARRQVTRPTVLASAKTATATRIGQLAALGLVLAALLSYSTGYGLLGGKFAED